MADSKQTAALKIKTRKEEILKNGIDLGQAKSDVLDAGYGGWVQEFANGNIYSHHIAGTFEVRGKILPAYLNRKSNGVNPALKRREFGFPKSGLRRTPDDRYHMTQFEWGQIMHVFGAGGVGISGEIYEAWIKDSPETRMNGLGYPINGNAVSANGETVFFERGVMYHNPDRSATPIKIYLMPPLMGNPAIVLPDEKALPLEVFLPSKDWAALGDANEVINMLTGRFFLQATGSTQRIPLSPSLRKSGTYVKVRESGRPSPPPAPGQTDADQSFQELAILWEPGKTLQNRTLYDLVFKLDDGNFYPFSPHCMYAKTSWQDFGLIHATDIHVARRIDGFKTKLKEARETYKRTDLDEGIEQLNNWNDGFRDLIRYANYLHQKGVLDGIMATGDLVDYQFEDEDNRAGGGNLEFFRQLVLGQVEYPDSDEKVEELMVPVFTVLGNHDYRPNSYKILCELSVGGEFGVRTIKNYNEHNITEVEARAIQDGRPSDVSIISYGKPQITLEAGERMIKIGEPGYYFKYTNTEKSYTVNLGKHRLVMLDSGPDTGLPSGKLDAVWTALGNNDEDDQTASSGGPNSVGISSSQIQKVRLAQDQTMNEGLIIIGTHSPLFNPKGSEFSHYFRETEHPSADEFEMANYLRRRVPINPWPQETMTNEQLLQYVKVKFKDWLMTGTPYFKTGDNQNLLDDGVSRGEVEKFLKTCAGLLNGRDGDPLRPVDLVLFGHKHTRSEMRIKWDNTKKELRFFTDFYTENPAQYYASFKYRNDFGDFEKVYIRIKPDAKPNGKPGKLFDEFWGEVSLLAIPPYAQPLEDTQNPAQWWRLHRPLFLQGAPLGPTDNNSRRDKRENKNRPDPSFEGCRLIVVRGDVIKNVVQIPRTALKKGAWKLPKGVAVPG